MIKYQSRLYKEVDLKSPNLKLWSNLVSSDSYLDSLKTWNYAQILECLFQQDLLFGAPGIGMVPDPLLQVLDEHNVIINNEQPSKTQRDALSYVVKMGNLFSFLRRQKELLLKNTIYKKFSFFCTTWLFSYLTIEQGLEFVQLLRREYISEEAPIIFVVDLNNEEDYFGVDAQEFVSTDELTSFLEMIETMGLYSDCIVEPLNREHNAESVFINLSKLN